MKKPTSSLPAGTEDGEPAVENLMNTQITATIGLLAFSQWLRANSQQLMRYWPRFFGKSLRRKKYKSCL